MPSAYGARADLEGSRLIEETWSSPLVMPSREGLPLSACYVGCERTIVSDPAVSHEPHG